MSIIYNQKKRLEFRSSVLPFSIAVLIIRIEVANLGSLFAEDQLPSRTTHVCLPWVARSNLPRPKSGLFSAEMAGSHTVLISSNIPLLKPQILVKNLVSARCELKSKQQQANIKQGFYHRSQIS